MFADCAFAAPASVAAWPAVECSCGKPAGQSVRHQCLQATPDTNREPGGGEGGEAARGGVLEVTSLACEVSDAHGMRCHLMTCLTMCRPFDGLVFGVSKLALQLMRSLAVRGKWTLPS